MTKAVEAFVRGENGAVTVDWVVLTAAVCALNMVVLFAPAREAIVDLLAQVAESIGIVGQDLQEAGNRDG